MATAKQELVTLDEAGLRALSQADEGIAELKERYLPLAIKGPDDTNGFKLVHAARMDVRNRRVGIEKTRKSLKADALEFGRRVDAEAKRITDQLSVIEEHLDAQETAYEDAREAIKRKAEEAKQAALQDRIDALRAVDVVLPVLQVAALTDDAFKNLLADSTSDYEAKQARIEAERVERERLEAEAAAARKAEDERLAKERVELEAERKRIAAEQAEQKRIADEAAAKERAAIEAERKRMAEEQAKSTKLSEGRCVKFIDPETGGWQIGRVMMLPASAGLYYRYEFCPRDDTRLVRTSPGGELVIVAAAMLSPYAVPPLPRALRDVHRRPAAVRPRG